ncbi:MAG: dienelactone hydrolase family protein [Planctomycetes bacterium]|nr:dienelactone hydrolase family protein [Planctomycetota bacterium]
MQIRNTCPPFVLLYALLAFGWAHLAKSAEAPASGQEAKQTADAEREETRRKARLAAGLPADDTKAAGSSAKPAGASAAVVPPGFEAPKTGWPADAKKGLVKAVPVEGITEDVLKTIEKAGGMKLPSPDGKAPTPLYHMVVPADYSPEKAWPLVLVLHGGPGRADNLLGVFGGRLSKRGAIAVFPQSLRDVLLEWNYPHEGMYLLDIVKQVAKTYRIDPKRVYLIGHSMGGGGTWLNGAVLRNVWAAIGPMSGWYKPTPAPDPALYKDMPAYFIHGDQDHNVPVQLSRMADKELKQAGNTNYVYVEMPGVGHDVPRYGEEMDKLCDWILKQTKPAPADLKTAEADLLKWAGKFGWSPEGSPVGSYKEK